MQFVCTHLVMLSAGAEGAAFGSGPTQQTATPTLKYSAVLYLAKTEVLAATEKTGTAAVAEPGTAVVEEPGTAVVEEPGTAAERDPTS